MGVPFLLDGSLVRRVELTRGEAMLIDDADAALAASRKWWLGRNGYAAGGFRVEGKKVKKYFHRLVANPPPGYEVDHVNGNPLDNRRANLRPATSSQNKQNCRRSSRVSKTGVRGVSLHYGRFQAICFADGKRIRVGRFDTLDEAAAAVAEARARLQSHSPEATEARRRAA